MKKYLIYVFKIIFSLTVLYFIFQRIDFNEVFSHLKNANIFYLFLAFLVDLLCLIISSKKWQILIQSARLHAKLKDLIYFNFLSMFYGSFLPGSILTGEAIKCYRIAKGKPDKTKLVVSIIYDKLIALFAYIIMGTIFLLIVYGSFVKNYQTLLGFMLMMTAGVLLFVLVFLNPKIIKPFFSLLNKIKLPQISRSLYKLKVSFLDNFQKKTLLVVFLYSILGYGLNILVFWFCSLSLGLEIHILHLFWIGSLVTILALVPVTILGLGIREGSFVYFLGLLGVSSVNALSLSFLVFAVVVAVSLIGGLLELISIAKKYI